MRPEDFNVQELIEYLQGTCNSMHEGVKTCCPEMEEEELTEDDHIAIDNEIFNCTTCNWWYELADMSHDGETCLDCKGDEDEEEF